MAAASVGYLLGMIPSADIAARISRRSDLRATGTGNPGGMNAVHMLGKSWGAAVTVADIGKGVAAARLGRALAGDAGANLASTAAVGGHCYPLGRTGGKGSGDQHWAGHRHLPRLPAVGRGDGYRHLGTAGLCADANGDHGS